MRSEVSVYVRRHWKLLLNTATAAALIILIIVIHKDLLETFQNITKVHAWAIAALVPLEFLNYDAQARMYYGLFVMVGNKLTYWRLYAASLEMNFINSVFPSGGVSGISYFGIRMRGETISGGKATVVQLLKLVLTWISFELLLILGLFFIAIEGHVNNFTVLVAAVITTLLVVFTFAFMMVIGSRKRINATFESLTAALNRLIHVVRPKHPETISIERFRPTVNELHDNYRLIQDNYKQLKRPLIWATMANLTEVLAVYVVFIAFGHWVNFGAIILAYAVANFAGLVSILPSGVGIYEALMTGVLAITGISPSVSLPVIIMYRIVNTLIQLPPGYVFYRRALQQTSAEQQAGEQDKETTANE